MKYRIRKQDFKEENLLLTLDFWGLALGIVLVMLSGRIGGLNVVSNFFLHWIIFMVVLTFGIELTLISWSRIIKNKREVK